MDGSIGPTADYLTNLSAATGRSWPMLTVAREAANEARAIMCGSLAEAFGDFATQDVDVIAFGSLARQEWTSGSVADGRCSSMGKPHPPMLAARSPMSRS